MDRLCIECGYWAGNCLCPAGSCLKCGEPLAHDADGACGPCDVVGLPPSRRWAFSVRARDERKTERIVLLSTAEIVEGDVEGFRAARCAS